MFEEHSRSLRIWLELIRNNKLPADGMTLVHIDSHSDMMDSDLKGHVEIGDFVTRALFLNIIDRVFWLRSDFSEGEYNGPGLGQWQSEVALHHQSVCFPSLHQISKDSTNLRNSIPVAEFENCNSDQYHIVKTLTILVATLQSPLRTITEFFETSSYWLLDIDLDFFSTQDPSVYIFEKFGFTHNFIRKYVTGIVDSDCEFDTYHSFTSLAIWMANISDSSPGFIPGTRCFVLEDSFEKLVAAVLHRQAAWKSLWLWIRKHLDWPDDLLEAILVPDAESLPRGRPHDDLEQTMRQFENLLIELVRYKSPSAITISRSMEHCYYLPTQDAELIQDLVLGTLNGIFPDQLERLKYADNLTLFKKHYW